MNFNGKRIIDFIQCGNQNLEFEELKEHCEAEVVHFGNAEKR